jgi:hypothetical protein
MLGISPVVQGDSPTGVPITAEQKEQLFEGMSEKEVLHLLGPPQRWIRRLQGSLMSYEAELGDDLGWYIGVPPLASGMAPVPGIENLRFRWWTKTKVPYKTLIFFDTEGKLASVVHTAPEAEGEAGEDGDEEEGS